MPLFYPTPGGQPICIDTSAASCISNNDENFVNLTPLSNTVLKRNIQWPQN
jgi:hypothetical protein